MTKIIYPFIALFLFPGFYLSGQSETVSGSWADYFKLNKNEITLGSHHMTHEEIFSKYSVAFNKAVLKGIDIVQEKAPDGGGYFADIKAIPLEAPIGYNLKIFNNELFNTPRKTSYCSGATYAAFVEAINILFPGADSLTKERAEALRMFEPDETRREDGIKFWGKWNDDGPGTHFALVQYSGIGRRIKLEEARPGDFMNINWIKGGGHSVIFLGWYEDETGKRSLLYWSSQQGTNGIGDQLVSVERIKSIVAVRLTNPENIFTFDPTRQYSRNIQGDPIAK